MLSHIQKYDILLASNSPRRRELLSGLGIEYQVTALPNIDESYPETLQGEEIPQYSYGKSRSLQTRKCPIKPY